VKCPLHKIKMCLLCDISPWK